MPLAEHDNVVKAFRPERTDRPFTISALPRRSRRGWPIPNAHRPKAADAYGLNVAPRYIIRDLAVEGDVLWRIPVKAPVRSVEQLLLHRDSDMRMRERWRCHQE
jgi:hypothetical protein